MHPYERLDAWHNCHRLVLAIYDATGSWPIDERFGLTSQVRRAAVSAAANLAEGSGRRGSREFHRFLQIAFGSLVEVSYLLRLAKDLGHIDDASHARIDEIREVAAKLTWRLCARIGALARQ